MEYRCHALCGQIKSCLYLRLAFHSYSTVCGCDAVDAAMREHGKTLSPKFTLGHSCSYWEIINNFKTFYSESSKQTWRSTDKYEIGKIPC